MYENFYIKGIFVLRIYNILKIILVIVRYANECFWLCWQRFCILKRCMWTFIKWCKFTTRLKILQSQIFLLLMHSKCCWFSLTQEFVYVLQRCETIPKILNMIFSQLELTFLSGLFPRISSVLRKTVVCEKCHLSKMRYSMTHRCDTTLKILKLRFSQLTLTFRNKNMYLYS